MTTDQRIEALEKLEKEAKQGPWDCDYCGDVWSIRELQECPNCLLRFETMIGTTKTGPGIKDAAFISTVRNELPWLLESFKKMRAALEEYADPDTEYDVGVELARQVLKEIEGEK